MFKVFGIKRKSFKNDLLDIESILQASLKPVSPRPEFIHTLHKGLMEYTFPQPESSELNLPRLFIIAMISFFSLAFVLSIWIRLVIVIISALGMIQSSKGKKRSDT